MLVKPPLSAICRGVFRLLLRLLVDAPLASKCDDTFSNPSSQTICSGVSPVCSNRCESGGCKESKFMCTLMPSEYLDTDVASYVC